jgi:hypothetical protein
VKDLEADLTRALVLFKYFHVNSRGVSRSGEVAGFFCCLVLGRGGWW